MNFKLLLPFLGVAVASSFLTYLVATQQNLKRTAALQSQRATELSSSAAEISALQQKLQAAELERNQYRSAAADIHKLRAETSQLRDENKLLQKNAATLAQQAKEAQAAAAEAAPSSLALPNSSIPESFPDHASLAQFASGLRGKAREGRLSPEEAQWLQQVKPELDKLEAHPRDFAEFQSAMIQEIAGINDPQKAEQIRNTIQRVYEAANDRGLHLQGRPQDDAAWIEQRHQLDRRGTGAIQKLLSDEERRAFDRSFLGIMGVDLGTGVDKSLYPPGFNQEERVSR